MAKSGRPKKVKIVEPVEKSLEDKLVEANVLPEYLKGKYKDFVLEKFCKEYNENLLKKDRATKLISY